MKKDLIILVADMDAYWGIDSLLQRNTTLKIKSITYDIKKHPYRDNGVYTNAQDFLRPFHNNYSYALVFLDFEGCGQEHKKTPLQIATDLKSRIEANGWRERVEVIVFTPELENWIWSSQENPPLTKILQFNSYQEIRDFLQTKKFWDPDAPKPVRPKEAFEELLKLKKIPRSPALYQDIGSKVPQPIITHCQDPAFQAFLTIIQRWFPRK